MSDPKTKTASAVLKGFDEISAQIKTYAAEKLPKDTDLTPFLDSVKKFLGANADKATIEAHEIPRLLGSNLTSAFVAKETAIAGVNQIEAAGAKSAATLLQKSGLAEDAKKAALEEITKVATEGLDADKAKTAKEGFEKSFKNFDGSMFAKAAEKMQMNPRTTALGALVAAVAGIFAFKSGLAKTDEQGQETEKGSFWKKALGALLVVGGAVAAVQAHKGIANAVTDTKGYWATLVDKQRVAATFKGMSIT